jgi:threonylcarbamoyladenosine tRNA methylthiotransferase MtaB
MLRRTTQAQFRELVTAAREAIPHVCITSDMIVGFPGETEDEFAISEAFAREMNFAGMHVFRYSRRPGTAADRMRAQVSEDDKKLRSARLIALAEQGERAFADSFMGQTFDVLWEQVAGATDDGFINVGYTDHYIRVRCVHPRALTDQITPARLDGFDGQHLCGTPIIA